MNMRPQKHEQKGRGDLAVRLGGSLTKIWWRILNCYGKKKLLMATRNCSQQKEIAMIIWPVTGHGVN